MVLILGLLSIIAPIATPMIFRVQKNEALAEALSNSRSIGLCLVDFEKDFGSKPNAETIPLVRKRMKSEWPLTDATSNDLFKQLIAGKVLMSEEIFHNRQPGTQRPDNVVEPFDAALSQGECGFSYILGSSPSSHHDRPLLVAPLIPGSLKFDPKPFKGKAVILRNDLTAISAPISNSGNVLIGGMDLFDSRQPFWEGKQPEIKWPDLVRPKKFHLALVMPAGVVVALLIGWALRRRKELTRPNRQSSRNRA